MKKIFIFLILIVFSLSLRAENGNFNTLDGRSLSYTEIISHPKAVLFIWTTWCPGCRSEIKRLARECGSLEGSKDINIFYINTGEKQAMVKRFIDSSDIKDCIRQNIILDTGGYLARKFRIPGVPAFIFIVDNEPAYLSHFINTDVLREVFGNDGPAD